jgi:hypothetical protein
MINKIILSLCLFSAIALSQTQSLTKLDSVADEGYYVRARYPNPYDAINYIEFSIPDSSNVVIFILGYSKIENDLKINYKDTLKIVYQGILEKGTYRCIWNWQDRINNRVSSGYYAEYIKAETIYNDLRKMSFIGMTKIAVVF